MVMVKREIHSTHTATHTHPHAHKRMSTLIDTQNKEMVVNTHKGMRTHAHARTVHKRAQEQADAGKGLITLK